MDECYVKLRDQVTNSELYEENLNLLRQIIEVIIWGDQNKMPFTAVSPRLLFYFFLDFIFLLYLLSLGCYSSIYQMISEVTDLDILFDFCLVLQMFFYCVFLFFWKNYSIHISPFS